MSSFSRPLPDIEALSGPSTPISNIDKKKLRAPGAPKKQRPASPFPKTLFSDKPRTSKNSRRRVVFALVNKLHGNVVSVHSSSASAEKAMDYFLWTETGESRAANNGNLKITEFPVFD